MNLDLNIKNILKNHATLIIFTLGLICLIVANLFELTILKVNIASLIANVGALLFVISVLQWVYDCYMRDCLTAEILSNVRISQNGIIDASDGKSPMTSGTWNHSKDFIIGLHYSSAFLDKYHDIIEERVKRDMPITILRSKKDTIATKYLSSSRKNSPDIDGKITEFDSKIHNSELITIIEHDKVLRYSFIMSDDNIWVKFLTNSSNYCPNVPALKIRKNSPLFAFFNKDIQELIKESSNDS